LKKTLEGSITAIARTIETRDPYTAGHQERVAQLAQAIAMELGLNEAQIEGLGFGGLIHDIGKISVPAELLSTPRRLRPQEMELIRGHAQVGYDIIKDIDFPWPVKDMILQHHERLDGSGYPQGLKEPEILYEAKILAVADVVEAMSSHRPYRPGFGIEVALEHIRECRGNIYDAKAVDACLTLFRDKEFAFKIPF
jgi:putative nucleotidyltransferase with HDIG domain